LASRDRIDLRLTTPVPGGRLDRRSPEITVYAICAKSAEQLRSLESGNATFRKLDRAAFSTASAPFAGVAAVISASKSRRRAVQEWLVATGCNLDALTVPARGRDREDGQVLLEYEPKGGCR
jgi:hypothetical protein